MLRSAIAMLSCIVIAAGTLYAVVFFTRPFRASLLTAQVTAATEATSSAEAQRLLRRSIDLFPASGSTHLKLARLYFNDYLRPDFQRFQRARGDAVLAVFFGKVEELPAFTSDWSSIILAELAKAERNLQSAQLYELRGTVLSMLGRFDEAAEDYRRAMLFRDDHAGLQRRMADLALHRGLLAWLEGDLPAATDILSSGLQRNADNPFLLTAKACALLRQGHPEQSRGLLQRSQRRRPTYATTALASAEVAAQVGDNALLTRQLRRLELLVNVSPSTEPIFDREAQRLLTSLETTDPEAMVVASRWMERLGLDQERRELLAEVDVDAPASLLYEAARMWELEAQRERAATLALQLIELAPQHLDGLATAYRLATSPELREELRTKIEALAPPRRLNRLVVIE